MKLGYTTRFLLRNKIPCNGFIRALQCLKKERYNLLWERESLLLLKRNSFDQKLAKKELRKREIFIKAIKKLKKALRKKKDLTIVLMTTTTGYIKHEIFKK